MWSSPSRAQASTHWGPTGIQSLTQNSERITAALVHLKSRTAMPHSPHARNIRGDLRAAFRCVPSLRGARSGLPFGTFPEYFAQVLGGSQTEIQCRLQGGAAPSFCGGTCAFWCLGGLELHVPAALQYRDSTCSDNFLVYLAPAYQKAMHVLWLPLIASHVTATLCCDSQ